jgi:hypothetical protein
VTNCLGKERKAASMNMKMFMPHVEKIAVVTGGRVRLCMSGLKHFHDKLTMSRNSTQTGDKSDFKTAITHNPCQARIRDLCLLPLFPSRSAAVFKSAVKCKNELNRFDLN